MKYIKQIIVDRIGRIVIENPPVNVLNNQLLDELTTVIDELYDDDNVKVITITGAGKSFVAGADIKEFIKMTNSEEAIQFALKGQEIFNKIEKLNKPVIAIINGSCLGGGLELAMACHIRIAANDANLGLPEINLGIMPGFAGTQRLMMLTTKAIATELILTGSMISGEEAARIGLVNKAVSAEQLEQWAIKMATKISGKGVNSIRSSLHAINQGYVNGQDMGMRVEAEEFGKILLTDDSKEGVQAFIEKRKPLFTDK